MRGKAGSMVVFLGDLPTGVTAKLLKSFVQQGIKGYSQGHVNICARICHCSILRITDLDSGRIEQHGLVEIRPALLAMHAIEQLNGARLLGKPITARRYRQRSPMGRQQRSAKPTAPHKGESDLPTVEQRRSNLKIELIDTEHGFFDTLKGHLQRPWWIRSRKAAEGPAAS